MSSPIGPAVPKLVIPQGITSEHADLLIRATAAMTNRIAALDPSKLPLKSRCFVCRKSEYTTLMRCACDLLVCAKHRGEHGCTFDHRLMALIDARLAEGKADHRKRQKRTSSDHAGPSGDAAY